MTAPEDDDLGIETFEEVYNRKYGQPEEPQQPGMLRRAADAGVFGAAFARPTKRDVQRTGARMGETLLGLPGDIRELVLAGGTWLGDKARQVIGKDPLTDEQKAYIREEVKPGSLNLVGQLVEALPTSQDMRGTTRKYTGEYLEPQNEKEAFADEVASDFAALALPVKGKIPFARALGQSLIANAGGKVAGAFGGDKAEAYTKMGLLFSTGMIGGQQKGLRKYISSLYDEMEAAIPAGAEVSAGRLASKMDELEAILRKGDPGATSKQPVLKKIEAIRSKIKGGKIDVDEVIQLTKDTNEAIFEGGPLKRAQNKLYDVREALHDATKEYGAENAAFLEKWKEANQAYASTELAAKFKNWVKRNTKPRDYAAVAGALGADAYALGIGALGGQLAGTAALAGTAYTAEVLKRINQSPALRRYYTNAITSALRDNKGGFVRAASQLNKGIEKSLKEEPYETITFDEDQSE